MEHEVKLVTLPLAELERLKEKNRRQAQQITYLQEDLRQRNLDLDALAFVWCSGSCPSGVHRFSDLILTEEMVVSAERNTERLREWFDGVKWRLETGYRSMSEWHRKYAERAAAKTDLQLDP